MKFLYVLQAIVTLLALLFLLHKAKHLKNRNRKAKSAPEPSGVLPLVGHLLMLNKQIPLYQTLAAFADKLGPIFTIRLGTKPILVISSWEAVKECLKTNDKIFLSRPTNVALKYLGYNGAFFGLSPYGPYWREVRKISIHELLSNTRLETVKHLRESEVNMGIRNLYSLSCSGNSNSALVNMTHWFENVLFNMMLRMIAGKRLTDDKDSQRFIAGIKKFMFLIGVTVVSDVIPFTEWLDLDGHIKSMKSTTKELDYFLSIWVEEHLQIRKEGQVKEERDFMDVMLSSMENQDFICQHKKETAVKAIALNLIIAGLDTTSVTMTWALSLVLNHPKVLKRAQEELDKNVGKERWVEESDFKNLPYLLAIIKETLRLYPAGPLSVPKESLEDCTVGGFNVRKGTTLLINLWKLHRDPRIWKNPSEFEPERFLDCNREFDVRGKHFEYVPFSSGRRNCPGISAAMQMSCLMLSRVLQGFNLSTPMSSTVDMSEGVSITMVKATPLQVIISPRLPRNLYQL